MMYSNLDLQALLRSNCNSLEPLMTVVYTYTQQSSKPTPQTKLTEVKLSLRGRLQFSGPSRERFQNISQLNRRLATVSDGTCFTLRRKEQKGNFPEFSKNLLLSSLLYLMTHPKGICMVESYWPRFRGGGNGKFPFCRIIWWQEQMKCFTSIHYQYKLLGAICILCNLRRKKLIELGYFIFWRAIQFNITKISAS